MGPGSAARLQRWKIVKLWHFVGWRHAPAVERSIGKTASHEDANSLIGGVIVWRIRIMQDSSEIQ
jgi:hypothetical protein